MAEIDASGLLFSFDGLLTTNVQHFALESSSSDHYTWVTGNALPFYRITASSFDGGITAGLGGTVDTIRVTNDGNAPGFSIGDFDVPLAGLIDTANAVNNFEKFWETVLAGATTVVMPDFEIALSLMGDFVTVSAGQSLLGAADIFVGTETASALGMLGVLIGDAISVEAGATLTGGSDTWSNVQNALIVGDAGNAGTTSFGVINGGADRINLINTGATSVSQFLVGDVYAIGVGGVVNGGSDVFTLRDSASMALVVGDVQLTHGAVIHGGRDTILIETTDPDRAFMGVDDVFGDGGVISSPAGASMGGGDLITLTNVVNEQVVGDFAQVDDAAMIGGDDAIAFRGVLLPGVAAGAQLFPTSLIIAGDAVTSSGTAAITGGDDTITVSRAYARSIAGDVLESSGRGAFAGGDDTVSALMNRNGASFFGAALYGDVETSSSRDFTGGNDTIALNVQSIRSFGVVSLYGDADQISTIGGATIAFGDDVMRVTGDGQEATIYGDARIVSNLGVAPGPDVVTIAGGDDSLTGGGGDDGLYGDVVSTYADDGATGTNFIVTGGNDTLDGRGGNDFIDGGTGTDTAVFGLNQAVNVNLNGMPGSTELNPYEAIGQGNDQLVRIENVVGSARNDVIVGNGGFNVLAGMAGADKLNGGAGEDTASYAGSNAGVVVNLSTGVASGGHAQGDRLVSFERLTGSNFADTFVGTSGVNVLDGGLGADSLRGLGGSDIYVVDNSGDVVDEAFSGSGGTDTVRATISVSLSNAALFKGDVENVTLLAGTGLNAVGNGLANTITGNATGNALAGGLGNDTLAGGGGADRFLFNTALGASNVDRIADFAIDDRIDLENAIFTALTTTGALASNLFKNTAAGAIDGDDRVIYNAGTGALIYDTNGSGAGGATQFAQLATGLALTNADFFVT